MNIPAMVNMIKPEFTLTTHYMWKASSASPNHKKESPP